MARKYNSKWRKLYNTYKREIKRLSTKGYETLDDVNIEDLNIKQFRRRYKEYSQNIELGVWKRPANISKNLAQRHFYEYSYKEAKAVYKYAKESGVDELEDPFTGETVKISLENIRRGDIMGYEEAFYEAIRHSREQLFRQGLSKEEVAHEIGRRFWGSP